MGIMINMKKILEYLKHNINGFRALFGTIILILFILIFHELRKTDETIVNENTKYTKQLQKLEAGISLDNKRKWKVLNVQDYIRSIDSNISVEKIGNYSEWIVTEGEKQPYLNYRIISSVIKQESRFNEKAESPAGARGLMQLIPLTAEDNCQYIGIKYKDKIEYNPEYNIRLGSLFLNRLIERFGLEQGLAYYNGGYRGRYRYSLLMKKRNGEKLNKEERQLLKRLRKETKEYVPIILNNIKEFEKMEKM